MQRTTPIPRPALPPVRVPCCAWSPERLTQRRVIDHGTVHSAACRAR